MAGLGFGGAPNGGLYTLARQSSPATLVQTPYGQAATTGQGAGANIGHVATAVPIGALALLAFIDYSLPASQKNTFRLITMTTVGMFGLLGGLRVVAHRHLAEGDHPMLWGGVKLFTG